MAHERGGRMSDLRFCFEARLGEDDGSTYTIGLEMKMGEEEVTPEQYEELCKDINMSEVMKAFCLDGIVDPDDIRLISPEEYDEKYEMQDIPSRLEG